MANKAITRSDLAAISRQMHTVSSKAKRVIRANLVGINNSSQITGTHQKATRVVTQRLQLDIQPSSRMESSRRHLAMVTSSSSPHPATDILSLCLVQPHKEPAAWEEWDVARLWGEVLDS